MVCFQAASESTTVRVARGVRARGGFGKTRRRVSMRAGERGTRSYDRGPDREQRAREAHRQSSETMNCNGGSSVTGETRKAAASLDNRPIVTCEFLVTVSPASPLRVALITRPSFGHRSPRPPVHLSILVITSLVSSRSTDTINVLDQICSIEQCILLGASRFPGAL